MSNGTSTIVAVFSIIASMAALFGLQATFLRRVIDSFRNEIAARLGSIEGRAGRIEGGIDRIEHELIRSLDARVTELERLR